jgi:hypothetical protein
VPSADVVVVVSSVIFATGCETPRADPPPASPPIAPRAPAPAADAQPALTVTLDGAPVVISDVVAFREHGWRNVMIASTHPLTCDAATTRRLRERASDVTFEVAYRDALRPDGTYAPLIEYYYYDGNTQYSAAWTTATQTTVDAQHTLRGARSGHTLHVAGHLVARTVCPVVAPRPSTRAPQPATITIAGHRRAVRFAELEPGTTEHDVLEPDRLTLYTGDESCDGDAEGVPSDFIVTLDWLNRTDKDPGAITLNGTAIGSVGGPVREDDALVTPRPRGAGRFKIHGAFDVAGYPVTVEGTITASVCHGRG